MAIDAGSVSCKFGPFDEGGIECGSVHCRTGNEQETCKAQGADGNESGSCPLIHWEFLQVWIAGASVVG